MDEVLRVALTGPLPAAIPPTPNTDLFEQGTRH
jgi:hypothetical protein